MVGVVWGDPDATMWGANNGLASVLIGPLPLALTLLTGLCKECSPDYRGGNGEPRWRRFTPANSVVESEIAFSMAELVLRKLRLADVGGRSKVHIRTVVINDCCIEDRPKAHSSSTPLSVSQP